MITARTISTSTLALRGVSNKTILITDVCNSRCEEEGKVRSCEFSCPCYITDENGGDGIHVPNFNEDYCTDIFSTTTTTKSSTTVTTTSTATTTSSDSSGDEGEGGPDAGVIVTAVIIPLLLLLLLFIAFIIWRRWKYGDTIKDIFRCIQKTGSDESVVKRQVDGTLKFSPNLVQQQPWQDNHHFNINHLHSKVFNNAQIFPMHYVEINHTLGKGAYGKVKRGFIRYTDFKYEVAVKSCTRPSGYEDIEREARVFLKLKERHMNIVNLLGETRY